AQPIEAGGELQFDPNAPPQGPMVIGAALSRPITSEQPAENSEQPPAEARLVVIGNSRFVADGAFEQQLNGDIFLNSVNWLSQDGDLSLAIRPKTATDRRIVLNAQQQGLLGVGAILVLPLIGFGAAVIAWLRRR
ncbi:MAG: ABC transporter, partial [Microcoleus sp. SIO2G3]|nr:ABC transporter [Microcoleus sp. SIO2G3]